MSDTKEVVAPTVDFAEMLVAYREGLALRARQAREKQVEVEEAASRVLALLPGRLRAGLVAEGVVSVAATSYANGLLSAEPADVARELNRRMGLTTGWVGDAALPGVCIPSKALVAVLEAQAGRDYVAGLPPERLRKVWAEWEDQEGHVVTFKDDLYHWTHWPPNTPIKRIMDVAWIGMKLRPLGNTHAYVEAMADEKERALPRPVENCGHVAADGTCGHPNALTPECHDGVVCPVKAERPVATPQPKGKRAVVMVGDLPYYADSVAFDTKGKLIKGEGVPFGLPPTPPAPTLLDLTKLPPGTVCEALEDIPRWNGRTVAAGVRFTLIDTSTEEGDEFPMVVTTNGENSYCIPYVVPARVVKEGGER